MRADAHHAPLRAAAAHDRWRRGGSSFAWVGGLTWLAIGFLCGESAIGICGYLLAYALCVEQGPLLRRLAATAPYAGLVIAWQAVYRYLGYGVEGPPV